MDDYIWKKKVESRTLKVCLSQDLNHVKGKKLKCSNFPNPPFN